LSSKVFTSRKAKLLDAFLKNLSNIKTIDLAVDELKLYIDFDSSISSALNFCIKAHENQFRKSGEPYVVHPILVATITAYFSGDRTMVISALLHDVVEDTSFSIEDVLNNFGEDVAHIVDGLTKITEIREHEFTPSLSCKKQLSQALSFRKMLIASIDDVRILVVKLCDRVHNMLTLGALSYEKQKRISEETLVVYAPIAHRLGISIIKNTLEDLAFYYLYPEEYKEIDNYIKKFQQKIQLNFNHFVSQTKDILSKMGYVDGKVQILSRIKHYYSIYLKMQRKGISIDEVLDLQAIRIVVNDELDCYKVLGLMHIEYKPLIARFKDYIATPKENGYKTIHTTVFHDSKIYEVQIRTFDMHSIAEYGVAAHWKYKSGDGGSAKSINLDWLHSLESSSDDIEEFYNDAKQDLYSDEIVVYSPKGDIFTLPRDVTLLDFAYEVHTDVGNKAISGTINKIKKPLLTQLQSGDIVSVETGEYTLPRCSWFDMVTTSKAKKSIKHLCSKRINDIDELTGKNIINTIFF
jgi:GTP pyrophosphokinase